MKHITSAQNEQLKHLAKLLSQAKARREHGQTVLEGAHLLQAYLQSGGVPEQVYIPESKAAQAETSALTAQLPADVLTLVSSAASAKITSLTEAEEIMTLIALPQPSALPQTGDCVVLERVQDPGNVGTILRSAAAAGVDEIVLSADSADVWSPKVLRAGMGAHFLLRLHARADVLQWRAGYTGSVWATALTDDNNHSLYALDLRGAAAWVFGNEGSGVSEALLSGVEGSVKIPMAGATESLNVAMAATVCLFEQMRQRLEAV
ncbi:RNA methyltransferase [Uruburuella testudinis]|uniref:RNA methyltransferase n=1 Tax=Uruburuella testudinis TaxID=1282863 RepID=A0ABY4DYH1_9NEIS|nr:RNA methyltransferase [Uruburuella testudinis]UOO83109.1 RNA methyltransferase [Uruburuella testudinis]